MNNIGNNLKKLLIKEEMSENELSIKLGISQQVINRIITGKTKNPTVDTLTPITEYFKISFDSLISNELSQIESQLKYKSKIPFIDFKKIKTVGIENAISTTERYISVDLESTENYFATSMYDDSMEPKFSKGTILIFAKATEAFSGEFCLFKDDQHNYIFRQLMINSRNNLFIKCFNPACEEEVDVLPLPINFYVLAKLEESRNIF